MAYVSDYAEELCDLMELRKAINEICSWCDYPCEGFSPLMFGTEREFKELLEVDFSEVERFFTIIQGCVSQRIATVLAENRNLIDECEMCCDCAVEEKDRRCVREREGRL